MEPRTLGLVALGSALGGVGRYLLQGWTTRGDFPTGTLLANGLGCFAIGVVVFGGLAGGWLSSGARVFLAIGLLGGFTTMSAFGYETVSFVAEGAFRSAALYVGATLALALVGTWLGRAVGVAVWGGA